MKDGCACNISSAGAGRKDSARNTLAIPGVVVELENQVLPAQEIEATQVFLRPGVDQESRTSDRHSCPIPTHGRCGQPRVGSQPTGPRVGGFTPYYKSASAVVSGHLRWRHRTSSARFDQARRPALHDCAQETSCGSHSHREDGRASFALSTSVDAC